MASAVRTAWLATCLLVADNASSAVDTTASDARSPSAYNPLPGGYSLSYDPGRWTGEFSVFQFALVDQFGALGAGVAASSDPRLRPLTRLDTNWTVNSPLGTLLPMRLGDGVSSAGLWDQPARMGGIQIGTYQPATPAVVAPPSLIAIPAGLDGPATVQTPRFIDHTRSLVQFQLQTLESAGQSDYSLESGRLRENFELRSSDYGAWITSGTFRYGVRADTTIDGEIAQLSGQQSIVGIGLLEGLGPLGSLSARVASSHDPDSAGWLARMGYDVSRDGLSFALRSHIQSPGFVTVGDPANTESFRQRTLASAGVDLGSLGRISLASATQTYIDDSRRDIVALSHAMPLGGGGIVSAAAAYSPGQYGSTALLLSFTYPFDFLDTAPRRVASAADGALDRTIIDAFGQTRLPPAGRLAP